MILAPIILIILVAMSYFVFKFFTNILWIYFFIAVGSFLGLLFLLFLGMIDLGFSDGTVTHGDGVADSGVGTDGAVDGGASTGNSFSLFFISPSSFLIISSLFGSFGIIFYNSLFFISSNVRDFLSIILASVLSPLVYGYVIRILFRFLKTTSMVKSMNYYEGKEAEVLYDIPSEGFGKINVKTEDKFEQILAKSEDGSQIPAGSIVRIKKYTGTFAIVEKL